MNWKEIKEKCPKAWIKLCDYHENEVVGFIDHPDVWWKHELEPSKWELRHLYDFFDLEGLNIRVLPEYYYDGINWNWQILWHDPTKPEHDGLWMSQCGGTGLYGDNHEYPTRTEAETAAFEKAFEILENKLK